jgi:transmembrane sensor
MQSPKMDNDRIWNLIAKKLAGEASAGELKELELVLRRDSGLHYSLEALEDMWTKQTGREPDQPEIAFQKHLERMHSLGMDIRSTDTDSSMEEFQDPPRRFVNWKLLAFTASIFFLLMLGLYFFNSRYAYSTQQKPAWEVTTRNGTKTNLLLPDGSTVWLNAGSRLTYDSLYGNSTREVSLSGEAYFDVVRNPGKPFIIHTGKINIRVLGTTFNVKSYPGEKTIETSLIKGSIEVTFPSLSSNKIILKPNQKLIIDKTEIVSNNYNHKTEHAQKPAISIQPINRVGSDSLIAETGWMQNRLYFDDMSFQELLKNMERKYGVSFQLEDSSLTALHFTGSFKDETVTQALDALRLTAEKSTADFKYEIKGDQVFIYNSTQSVQSIQPK